MLSTTTKMVQKHKKIAKGGQHELHSHLKDARGTNHWSPPRLHRWRKLENAYTNHFFLSFDENSRQWPAVCMSMDPPLRKKKHGPLCKWPPPLERRNTARAIDMGGGVTCDARYRTVLWDNHSTGEL